MGAWNWLLGWTALVDGFALDSAGFCWILLNFAGVRFILLDFTWFCWISLGFTGFPWVVLLDLLNLASLDLAGFALAGI